MTLREFKVRQLVALKELESELLSRYSGKADRIRYLVDVLEGKLDSLRTYTLYDYLRTISLVAKEFPEFSKLIPKQEEIEKLLGEEE